MSEDVFRWIVALGVLLAAGGVVVQAALVQATYRVTKATQDKLSQVLDATMPVVATLHRFIDESTPKVSQMLADSAAMVKTTREQVDRLGDVVKDASDRARVQIARLDGTLDQTIEQVEQVSAALRTAMVRPAKQMDGIMHGIRAAISVVAHGRRESVDHATQDEEMFI